MLSSSSESYLLRSLKRGVCTDSSWTFLSLPPPCFPPITPPNNPTSVRGIFQNKITIEVVGVISHNIYKQKLINSSKKRPVEGSIKLTPKGERGNKSLRKRSKIENRGEKEKEERRRKGEKGRRREGKKVGKPVKIPKSNKDLLKKIKKMSAVITRILRGSPPLGWKGTYGRG